MGYLHQLFKGLRTVHTEAFDKWTKQRIWGSWWSYVYRGWSWQERQEVGGQEVRDGLRGGEEWGWWVHCQGPNQSNQIYVRARVTGANWGTPAYGTVHKHWPRSGSLWQISMFNPKLSFSWMSNRCAALSNIWWGNYIELTTNRL